jgi:hypothetical protein
MVTLLVTTGDARAWASYIRGLRSDIDRAKREGRLDPGLAAPESIHETLMEILAAIDALPSDLPTVELRLPAVSRLRVFFHYALAIRDWGDRLYRDGLLRVARDPAADRFLAAIGEVVSRR